MRSQGRSPRTVTRVAALLLAATFTFLQLAEAAEVHRCAHHEGPSATTAEAHSHDAGTDHGSCTCMGNCQAPSGVALFERDTAAIAASAPSYPVGAPCSEAPPAAADHLLPFAHAPPITA